MVDYKPRYAEGEIYVLFVDWFDTHSMVRNFMEHMGYDCHKPDPDDFCYTVIVPAGHEEEACEILRKEKFVDWAKRKDEKVLHRWKGLDQAVEILSHLSEDSEIPDDDYNAKIDSAIEHLKSCKEYKG